MMTKELDDCRVTGIELDNSSAIIVEQIDDEIMVIIAGVVGFHFQVTAKKALELSQPWLLLLRML